jgi:integrase
MCDVDRPTVEAWLNEKTAAGLSHWTLLDLRNLLSAMFAKAAEWKLWQGENPCTRLKVGGATDVREKRIPKAEALNAFLEALGDTVITTAEGARLMVLTAVTAGLRVSEVLGLQPRDIDARISTLKVVRRWHRGNVDEPKSKASRRERAIGGLAAELLRFAKGKQPDAYIFGRADRNGDPPDDRDLQQHVFRPAAEAVGIYSSGFGMHTFRRLNITWRQEAGATPFEAQKAAGHAKPSTTWLYTVTDRDREREQVARIWDRIGGDPSKRRSHRRRVVEIKHGSSTKQKRAS